MKQKPFWQKCSKRETQKSSLKFVLKHHKALNHSFCTYTNVITLVAFLICVRTDESLGSHRVTYEKVTEWVSSIMCMLMSVTRVNLVEADNLEEAEIPISFLEEDAYKNLNQSVNSIAFCDIEQMEISERPRAPVYVNKYPNGSNWFSMYDNRLVFEKREYRVLRITLKSVKFKKNQVVMPLSVESDNM